MVIGSKLNVYFHFQKSWWHKKMLVVYYIISEKWELTAKQGTKIKTGSDIHVINLLGPSRSICILVNISSDNCLVPVSRQSKPWTNAELLSIGTYGTILHLLSDLDLISHASCGRWPNDLGRYSVTLKFPLASHAVCLRIVGCLQIVNMWN